MNSLIQELQQDATDSEIDIVYLARKAYVVARKLKVDDFEKWLHYEINGYPKDGAAEIPAYRKIEGELKGFNPMRGWIPIVIQEPKLYDALCNRKILNSLASIEDMINNHNGSIVMNEGPDNDAIISQMIGIKSTFRLEYSHVHLITVREQVRNIILDWSLRLERDGLEGVNMKFSKEELHNASTMNYTVNNFYGNICDTQIMQNSSNSKQKISKELDMDKLNLLVNDIVTKLNQLELNSDVEESIKTELNIIKDEISVTKPNSKRIRKSLNVVKDLFQGVGENLAASAIIYGIVQLL